MRNHEIVPSAVSVSVLMLSDLSETDAVQTQDESVLRQQRLRWGFGVRRCVALAVSVFLLRDAFGL